MPKSRRYGVKWHECARCGITYPEHRIKQNKLKRWICNFCWDSDEGEVK